jgi:hypothetical protein
MWLFLVEGHYVSISRLFQDTNCKFVKGGLISLLEGCLHWDNGVLMWRYPQLFSYAKKETSSVVKLSSNYIGQNLWLPMPQQVVH